jgi:hypothetical protein
VTVVGHVSIVAIELSLRASQPALAAQIFAMSGRIIATPAVSLTDSASRRNFHGMPKGRVWVWNPKRERAAEMRARGIDWPTISEEVGTSVSQLRKTGMRPEFRQRVREIEAAFRDEAIAILRRNAPKAAQVVVDLSIDGPRAFTIVEAKNAETQLKASVEILNRIGVDLAKETQRPPELEPGAGIDARAIADAQRAYAQILANRAGVLGSGVLQGTSPDQGADSLRALPVPGGVSVRPEPIEADFKVAPGGDEPDDRA